MSKASRIKPPADDVIASMAAEQDLAFLALEPRSHLVKVFHQMSDGISGLTTKAFVPSLTAAADAMLGPVQLDFVTQVDSEGAAINVASNISSAQACNVAPTGSVKTFTMNCGPRALGAATSALRKSKYPQLRAGVMHIPICKDGTSPTLLADDSAAFKFKTLEAHARVLVFGEFIDEPDAHLNRLESNGILDVNTELVQFNTGSRIAKNDGVTSGNREHIKVSRAINLQPFQCLRLINLDLGTSGVDDGSGRNLGLSGRNWLALNYKTGAGEDAITDTIDEYDYQAHIDKLFTSAGSSAAAQTYCPLQDLANKIVLGAKLASMFVPAHVEAKFQQSTDEFNARREAANSAADELGSPSSSPSASQLALEALEATAGLKMEVDEVETSPEPTKRFKTVDGQKVELEAALSPEQQSELWNAMLKRMVPSSEGGPPLARKWNEYDRLGDRLRATKPVEAGIVKKCKEHLGKVLPTVFFMEFSAYILSRDRKLRETPIGEDAWSLEFVACLRKLTSFELATIGVEYLFDPFIGRPMPRANLVSVDLTILIVDQSLSTFQLFLGEKTMAEPAWLALLHHKSPTVIARSVKDVRIGEGKCDSKIFEATAKALEESGLGYFVRVGRAKLSVGGTMGEGPYETISGSGTPFFIKLVSYDDSHSGHLSRAGSSLETMAAAATAVGQLPEYSAADCGEMVKMLLGLAGMTHNFHLLQGETTFKNVLLAAHEKRIGTKPGYSTISSMHKHLLQLVISLRRAEGRADLALDDTIAMPSPPRSALRGVGTNAANALGTPQSGANSP